MRHHAHDRIDTDASRDEDSPPQSLKPLLFIFEVQRRVDERAANTNLEGSAEEGGRKGGEEVGGGRISGRGLDRKGKIGDGVMGWRGRGGDR